MTDRARRAGRLSAAAAVKLLRRADTAELMGRADAIRRRLHGTTTCFSHSVNLNPTNVCENRCGLCAFWREAEAPDAYGLTLAEARTRLRRLRGRGLTDLHVVGGIRRDYRLDYYEALFRMAHEILPGVLIQGLTAVEIEYLARQEGIGINQALQRLRAAGLDAIPGGGAEIFRARIRARICAHKISARKWLAVHARAHALGLPSNATMLFGHLETIEDIVDHMARLRDLQDRTGGFQAFIPLPFQASGTQLDVARGPGGVTIVRVAALARIFLDNFPHIRMLVNYVDRKLLQTLLHAGVDDIGGTSLDERIARAAGAPRAQQFAAAGEMSGFIAGLGFAPRLVNCRYEPPPARPARRGLPAKPSARLAAALRCARSGRRLTAAMAVTLHDKAALAELGALAHRRRCRQVPGKRATFVIDRNISLTNVCVAGCRFCAFHVPPGAQRAFTLTIDAVVAKVTDAVARGATQVMLQGGLNPDLDLEFYERMFVAVKRRAKVCLHSLSPAEVHYLAKRSHLSCREVLLRLQAAGLDSLPGGGAEILVDEMRRKVSPHKISADDWFAVMETAHRLGLPGTATMVYGLGETGRQRVAHLVRIRDLQDRTGGFTAFIPWSFQPNRTQLAQSPASGPDYLRVVALARLVLDNVPHLQAGWVTEGPDLAQLALVFGADDFGGVLMEEQVVRATGTAYSLDPQRLASLITEAGFAPVQRTTAYELLRKAAPLHAIPAGQSSY